MLKNHFIGSFHFSRSVLAFWSVYECREIAIFEALWTREKGPRQLLLSGMVKEAASTVYVINQIFFFVFSELFMKKRHQSRTSSFLLTRFFGFAISHASTVTSMRSELLWLFFFLWSRLNVSILCLRSICVWRAMFARPLEHFSFIYTIYMSSCRSSFVIATMLSMCG